VFSFPSPELLDQAAKGHLPNVITADKRLRSSKALDALTCERGVKVDFITPGKPTNNGFVELFQDAPRRDRQYRDLRKDRIGQTHDQKPVGRISINDN
jgi:transposase InsO family protein